MQKGMRLLSVLLALFLLPLGSVYAKTDEYILKENEFELLQKLGITDEESYDAKMLGKAVDRALLAKIAVRLVAGEKITGGEQMFYDVPVESDFYGDIAAAVNYRLMDLHVIYIRFLSIKFFFDSVS